MNKCFTLALGTVDRNERFNVGEPVGFFYVRQLGEDRTSMFGDDLHPAFFSDEFHVRSE